MSESGVLLLPVSAGACLAALVLIILRPLGDPLGHPSRGLSPEHSSRLSRSWWRACWKRWRSRGQGSAAAESLRGDVSRLLRQYAALLQSGRSQPQAWADLCSHWRSRDPDHPLSRVCEQASAAEQAGLGAVVGLRRSLQASSFATAEAEVLREVLVRLIGIHALSQTTGAPLSGLCRKAAGSLEEAAALHAAIRTAAADHVSPSSSSPSCRWVDSEWECSWVRARSPCSSALRWGGGRSLQD